MIINFNIKILHYIYNAYIILYVTQLLSQPSVRLYFIHLKVIFALSIIPYTFYRNNEACLV